VEMWERDGGNCGDNPYLKATFPAQNTRGWGKEKLWDMTGEQI
jgi:hypothetical protein